MLMVNIKALRQRVIELKAKGREGAEKLSAQQALEALSEEQTKEIEALEARLVELEGDLAEAQAQVEAEEKRLDRERLFAPTEPPVRASSNEPDPARTSGFRDLAEFALSVHAASPGGGRMVIDERLTRRYAAPTNYHQESGTTEGYMVPAQFREEIWELIFADEDLLTAIDMEPTSGNSVEMLSDETTPWGATGVQAKWRAEASQMTATKLVTEPRSLKLNELYAFVTATDELLEDAPRLNARLTRKAADAIRWKASDAIIYGNGVGQPLGYFVSTALVSVAKEAGQAADTIVAANVLKMYSRLLPQNISGAFWLCNSDCIPQLMSMTLGNNVMWVPPSSGLVNAPGGILLGRPVRLSEHAKTVGDKGDIHLIDPMGYYGVQKSGGIKFDTSIHLFFDYGIQAFRWTFRFGGQPYLQTPITPPNSALTKSHFIVLDARA